MSGSDLGDDIVPNELPKHIPSLAALRTDFKPWHRVRKQFIRERLWNPAVRFLAQRYLRRDLQMAETEWAEENLTPENIRIERPLRCFLLPGDDLLDVRSLWTQLQNEGCYLRFLGFNKSLQDEERRRRVDIAESAVTQLTKVCKDSHVSPDTFQDIARTTTPASRLFRQYGPYDLINLDLCDSLVPRGHAGETATNYTALNQLIDYQLENQKGPWLLFVTTQVDYRSASQDEINKLAKPIRENCDTHENFAKEIGKLIPEAAFLSQNHSLDISQMNPKHLVQIFGVVFGKWLMSLLKDASPRCAIKLLTSYRYIIQQDAGIEMLSLGFIFTPHYSPTVDPTGLSTLKPTKRPFPTELECALQFASTAANIGDVDKLLEAQPILHQQLLNSKADLMAAAGYDRDAYLRWATTKED